VKDNDKRRIREEEKLTGFPESSTATFLVIISKDPEEINSCIVFYRPLKSKVYLSGWGTRWGS
jgi:CRISPR/Cas system CMR-associated protein Cmr1 (group 7 of RAMP superfamily)